MGMSGAAVATLISYVLLWIFHHLVSKYVIKEKLSLQNKAVYAGTYYNGNMCSVCLSDAGKYDIQMGSGTDSRSDCS